MARIVWPHAYNYNSVDRMEISPSSSIKTISGRHAPGLDQVYTEIHTTKSLIGGETIRLIEFVPVIRAGCCKIFLPESQCLPMVFGSVSTNSLIEKEDPLFQ